MQNGAQPPPLVPSQPRSQQVVAVNLKAAGSDNLVRKVFLNVDTLKTMLTTHTESRELALAASTAPQAVRQSVEQLKHPVVQKLAVDVLGQVLNQMAAKVGSVIESATQESVNAISSPETTGFVKQVLTQTAALERAQLGTVLDEKLERAGGGVPIQRTMEETVEAVALQSYQRAVCMITHFVLQQAVEMTLQATLKEAVNAFSDELLQLVQSQRMKPNIQPNTRLHARGVAKVAAADTMRLSLNQVISRMQPVRVQAAPSTPVITALSPPVQAAPLTPVRTAATPPVPAAPLTPVRTAPSPPVPAAPLTPVRTAPSPPVLAARLTPVRTAPSPPVLTASPTPAAPDPAPTAPAPEAPLPPVKTAPPVPVPAQPTTPVPPQVSTSPTSLTVVPSIPQAPPATTAAPAVSEASILVPDLETGLWKTFRLPIPLPSPEAPRPKPTIDALPDEILVAILRYVDPLARLSACGQVCRRWHALSRSDALWAREELRYDSRNKPKFSRVLMRAPQLKMVDCERMSRNVKGSRRAAVPYVPKHTADALLQTKCRVRGLRIVSMDMDAEFVIAVLRKHALTLEVLELNACPDLVQLSHPDTPSLLFHAIDRMPFLRKLSLTGNFTTEYTFLARSIGAPKRSLQELDLSGFLSPSTHTACSLLAAHQSSLRRVVLSVMNGADELINVSLCPCLVDLTVPSEVLERFAPASLPSVTRLTLSRASASDILTTSCSRTSGIVVPDRQLDRQRTLLLPALNELVLDGVHQLFRLPKSVRAVLGQVRSLTFRGTHMQRGDMVTLLQETKALESLWLDKENLLSDKLLQDLPCLGLHLKRIRITRSLKCTTTVCWRSVPQFLTSNWPLAEVLVDSACTCLK